MKRAVISAAAALSLALAAPVFSTEVAQPPAESNFEQVKADHLKRLEDRIKSLQGEKTCVEAAKNHNDLSACRFKHKSQMRDMRGEMRKPGGPMGPRGSVPPEVK